METTEKEVIVAALKLSEQPKKPMNIRIEDAYLQILDEWRSKRGHKTRTAAIKALILQAA